MWRLGGKRDSHTSTGSLRSIRVSSNYSNDARGGVGTVPIKIGQARNADALRLRELGAARALEATQALAR